MAWRTRAGGEDDGGAGRLPAPVVAAAALVALEGVVAVGYALNLAVRALVDDPAESVAGVGVGALMALLLGLGLVAAARGVMRLAGWTRGPVTTVQLLVLLTGFGFLQTGGAWLAGGVVALVLAGAVLGLLFAPASRAAFDEAAGR